MEIHMSQNPLADGFRRRKSYRAAATSSGIIGVLVAILGFATSTVWAVVLGVVLFVVVGFAFWLAANATVARAIDQAAIAALGKPIPAHVPEVLHRLNVGQFHEALERQARLGGTLDDAFRSQFKAPDPEGTGR